jgi:flagellar protein FlbD
MITLKRLNGTEFMLNAELIEQIERTPDTVITLTTGNNIVVRESVDDVVGKIIEYRQKIAVVKNERMASAIRNR